MKLIQVRAAVIFAFSIMFLFIACKKDDTILVPLQINLSIPDSTMYGTVNEHYSITATVVSGTNVKHEWTVNDSVYSRTDLFSFTPANAGIYIINYKAVGAEGTQIKKVIFTASAPIRPIGSTSIRYISKLYEYSPAPGQFMNETSVGSPAYAQNLVGKTGAIVSLGAFGGYAVVGFDHSIINKEGADLAIFGNPVLGSSEYSEPGIVMVMQDGNGNGLPDDQWFELAGSEYTKATTIRNYSITYYNPNGLVNVPWKDNQGKTGVVKYNTFHKHNFYPLFAANQDSLTFKGTLLSSNYGTWKAGDANALAWGYSDNGSPDYVSMTTPKYNSFDLNWAVDSNGNAVKLSAIDFVKVYTAKNSDGGAFGELSTELLGAVDLNMP